MWCNGAVEVSCRGDSRDGGIGEREEEEEGDSSVEKLFCGVAVYGSDQTEEIKYLGMLRPSRSRVMQMKSVVRGYVMCDTVQIKNDAILTISLWIQ